MIPPLAARLEAWMSQFASRVGVAKTARATASGRGSRSALSLGLVYAPCAGPILAGVITVSASQSFSAGRLAVALAYGIGSAVVLYFLMLGGRRVVGAAGPPRRRPPDRDGRGDGRRRPGDARQLRHPLPEHRSPPTCPCFLVNPTEGPRRTPPRRSRRSPSIRGGDGHGVGSEGHRGGAGNRRQAASSTCRCSARRPNSSTTERWFNTPGDKPLTMKRAARPGRPGRLLDLQLHQLHPHAALPQGLGASATARTA